MSSTTASTTRHRAYAWEDQSPTIEAAGTHDGLAILHAIGRQELPLPPALRTLDITPVEAEPGRVSFTLVPSEFHLNPFGLVHGGVSALLLDHLMGATASAGFTRVAMTGTLTLRYVAPLPLGEVRLAGRVAEDDGRKVVVTATIGTPDRVAVEATGLFIVPSWSRADGSGPG